MDNETMLDEPCAMNLQRLFLQHISEVVRRVVEETTTVEFNVRAKPNAA